MASHENRVEKNIPYKDPITRISITSKRLAFFWRWQCGWKLLAFFIFNNMVLVNASHLCYKAIERKGSGNFT
jgi:hypothetical protein